MFHSYKSLPKNFYQEVFPEKVPNPKLIKFNYELAEDLGLEERKLKTELLAQIFSGNSLLEGFQPMAQAYAGHQFGNFVPSLGDGRALLIKEVLDRNGKMKDIQLKGSGRTPFSRNGDGKSWLGPVIREYIVSEAMHKLGIPSTRSLAMLSTGETVYREGARKGGILTRVASSHIRVGTFEYFAYRKDLDSLKILADYVIKRHYEELAEEENKYIKFFESFSERQTDLICKWLSIGFIHGVMNTDNFSISAESLDFGPCAFMESFNFHQVYSSIDYYGRYSFSNQASICIWNLSVLANTLIPLIDSDEEVASERLRESLEKAKINLEEKLSKIFLKKIGFKNKTERTRKLSEEFLNLLQKYRVDFTLAFRELPKLLEREDFIPEYLRLFDDGPERDFKLKNWISEWKIELSKNYSKEEIVPELESINPIFIPRNHLIEECIEKAHDKNDFTMIDELLKHSEKPYLEEGKTPNFISPREDKNFQYLTFCGT
jgi:serine/tyrosine/threonine adenylyltransferase